jgi:hypothetical protein
LSYFLALLETVSGASYVEVSDGRYSRRPVTLQQNGPVQFTNAAGLTFGPFGAALAAPILGVFDAMQSGNLLFSWSRPPALAGTIAATVTISAGGMKLAFPTIANAGMDGVSWQAGDAIGQTESGLPVVAGVALQFEGGAFSAIPVASTTFGNPSFGQVPANWINAERVMVNGDDVLIIAPADLPVDFSMIAAGTVDVTLHNIVLNATSNFTVTVPSGVTDGHVLTFFPINSATYTLSLQLDGLAATPTMTRGNTKSLKWWAAGGTWLTDN